MGVGGQKYFKYSNVQNSVYIGGAHTRTHGGAYPGTLSIFKILFISRAAYMVFIVTFR